MSVTIANTSRMIWMRIVDSSQINVMGPFYQRKAIRDDSIARKW